ncbi:MAG: dihydroorotate dehydrogenase electron transfer subunit [Clostridia bacterium]|nr:dihydroorotate dehydrogenase electron transfer subunit [Clostridia bacterium]MBO5299072.1 dihydroorotate dehydrogenase electron transfer subunit [Clostridia bacterium]MBQ2720488.1 dihydroorotate dehydrogenase electron transfer subunit [Clostridia bacterium]MBQ4627933.1 dihydroorotate dehydrogenase electron transfer subunit [Clostridia bacterium]
MDKRHLFCEIITKQTYEKLVDFTVALPDADKICAPGQFIHVLCGGQTFLRRPISICDVSKDTLRFIFEIRGEGTQVLSEKKVGDIVDMLAPLGHGFELTKDDENVIAIGGGIGCFPLLNAVKACGSAKAILGFRNKEAVYDKFIEDFENVCPVDLMTDDGSAGVKGFTTQGLEKMIADGEKISKIITCGPMVMMEKIIDIAQKNNIPCLASFEERMGCGIGTCLCCSTKVNGQRRCICKEGPVLNF